MQGVQPNPNAAPTTKGKVKLLLYWLLKNLISLFMNLKFMIPSNWNEKSIITTPAIILKVSELFRKKFPINVAVNPKDIKTNENPKVKKMVLTNIKFLFFWLRLLSDVPEI